MTISEQDQRHFKIRFGPCGVHFFNRASGLNILLDEVIVSNRCWAIAPRHVSIALTNACDLKCAFCFAPKHVACLPFERLIAWLAELDENGTIGVGFGGGEPTLHPRFVELCAHTARHTRLAVTFTTHAHRLTERLLTGLTGNVHFIRVSMDGVGATYERLRGKQFDALRRRMGSVRKVVAFGINYVVNNDTIEDLDVALEVGADAGATEMLLLPEQRVASRPGIDADTLSKLRKWVDGYRGDMRLAISENAAETFPTCDGLVIENGLRAYAHITADAILKRTSFDPSGVVISTDGLLPALDQLSKQTP